MKHTLLLAFIITLSAFSPALAQNGVSVSTTNALPDPSAMLDVSSTAKGMLVPRMSATQRTAISGPATGLLVYDTDSAGFIYYTGAAWKVIQTTGGANASFIKDGDGNTRVATDVNGDDNVHFTLGGTEYFTMNKGTLEWNNTNGCVYLGQGSGTNAPPYGYFNVGIGANSLQNVNSGSSENTGVGHWALQNMISGGQNTVTGSAAMRSLTSGNNNAAYGNSAIRSLTSGSDNAAYGNDAMHQNLTGNQNTAVGSAAGYNNTGSGNVFLGYNAGANEAGSNKLYIDNTSAAIPLIYGDFALDSLRINGKMNINGYYTLPKAAGTAGYIMQTNGSGQASWVSPATLPVTGDNLGNHTAMQNINTNGYFVSGDGTSTGIKMGSNGQLVDTGTFGNGADITIAGAGTRMIWYPKKAAFRAGTVAGAQWDNSTIGNNSIAAGKDLTASGDNAAAFGLANTASGLGAFTVGWLNTVSGTYATAFGQQCTASGYNAFATGGLSAASGQGSTAMGLYTQASGSSSAAIGNFAIASGNYTVAIGRNVSTNGKAGSFVFGDTSATTMSNDAFNQMKMRFKGGYKLYIDETQTNGIQIVPTTGVAKYFNNVASAYDARSLTDRNYVDSNVVAALAGITETDPQVSSTATNTIPKWNGTTLTDGTIVDNGNIGIGTANPTKKLEVAGTAKADSVQSLNFKMGNGASNGYVLQSDATGNAAWVSPTSLSITETDPQVSSSATNAIPKWNGTTLTDGTIVDNGNVGIGTANPAKKLEVIGTAKADSVQSVNFKMTNGAAPGYVLQSNAAGNAAWVSPLSFTTDTTGIIADADANTKVVAGTTATEDKIHFTLGGTEYFTMNKGVLEVNNTGGSVYFGSSAGSSDNYLAINHNTGIGSNALQYATLGDANTAVGYRALQNLTLGQGNTTMGLDAGRSINTGYNNTAIGVLAGNLVTTGSNNTLMGYLAGNSLLSGDGNIFIGYSAGFSETGSNKLYIANSGTTTPLVYGDFAANSLRVNGVFTVTGNEYLYSNVSVYGSETIAGNQTVSGNGYIAGNAGIGTTAPTSKLEVAGDIRLDGYKLLLRNSTDMNHGLGYYGAGATNGTWGGYSVDGPVLYGYSGGVLGAYDGTTQTNTLTWKNNGRIGIGTSNPTKAQVEINGSINTNNGAFAFFAKNGTSANSGYSSGGNNDYSLYASQRIAASEFNSFSDRRIKRVIGQSNAAQDLATLMQLRITDYRFIDTVEKGGRRVKKVIAQEVEEVYPQAVSQHVDEIPDIYRLAAIKAGIVTVPNNLKAGEQVKLIFGNRTELAEVIEANAASFKVALPDEGPVFVYGRQVNDFRTVDYDALSMLSISATQELVRQVQELQSQNKAANQKIRELSADMQAVKAALGLGSRPGPIAQAPAEGQ